MSVIVGLSGGIGSGKTTVARMLEKLGASVIDADAIVHELQSPGSPMLREIADAFGDAVIDPSGALDRKALANLVFRDPEARDRLGAIVHPPVGVEMRRRAIAASQAGAPLVVLDIPLLFEGARAGRDARTRFGFASTVLVWAPREMQIERTVARDGCSREDAVRRIESQLGIDEKRAMADHVIDNSGSIEETREQVRALFATLVACA